MASVGYPNTDRVAYNAIISLNYIYNNNVIVIAPERIKFIVIDSNYENEVMPKIYMNISINADMYESITTHYNSAKFKLKIQRKNSFSNTSLAEVIVNDTFSYIPSVTNSDYLKDISTNGSGEDNYRNIYIGLISDKITNSLRKTFNGIYNNIDQQTLIALATENMNILVQPFNYNKTYSSILIPPISSIGEFIKYIFDYDNFYNTNYIFFMDFNKSYLLAKDGLSIFNSDDPINDVYVDVAALNQASAFYDGMNIINNSYYLYINPVDSNVIVPNAIDKVVNRLVVVDNDKELETLDLYLNNNQDKLVKDNFIRADNGSVYKNELEEQNVMVEVVKKYVDGYSFTPNKSYIINNLANYRKYNGKYILVKKKEYFRVMASGEFITSCYLGFKKIGTITTKNSTESRDLTNKAVKTSSQYTTSADNINTTTIRKASRYVN